MTDTTCTMRIDGFACPTGQLYAASDVQEVAEYMHDVFASSTVDWQPSRRLGGLAGAPGHCGDSSVQWQDAWLPDNPLGVPTEREVHSLEQGILIHRFLLCKRSPDRDPGVDGASQQPAC